MVFNHIRPYMGLLSDHHQRIIRYLYEQRYTRPYVGAMLGISIQQVMTEELAALRSVICAMATAEGKPKPKRKQKSKAESLAGQKMERGAAGPSGVEA